MRAWRRETNGLRSETLFVSSRPMVTESSATFNVSRWSVYWL
jgi:hypothetical protein